MYQVMTWSINGEMVTGPSATFIMPDTDVIIDAYFTNITQPSNCFILTAIGDTELTGRARDWRDSRNWMKPVNRVYYIVGPPIAYLIRNSRKFRRLVTEPIKRFIELIV